MATTNYALERFLVPLKDMFAETRRTALHGVPAASALPLRAVFAPAGQEIPVAERVEISLVLPGWELAGVSSGTRSRRHTARLELAIPRGGLTDLAFQRAVTAPVEALIDLLEANRDREDNAGLLYWHDGEVSRVEEAPAREGDPEGLVRVAILFSAIIEGDH